MATTKRTDTILLVEDEPEVRSYLEMSLRCRGYKVQSTEDGEEALQFLDERGDDVSLVLMDVVMPRMDGLATLQQLRRTHRDLPVVMLSGASSTPTIVEAMKSGATDFFAKPIGHADLAAAVQKALSATPRRTPDPIVRTSSQSGSTPTGVRGGWLKRME